MKPNQNTISDLQIERYLLKELPEDEMQEIETRIKNNFVLEEKVAKMRIQNESILKELKPSQMAQRVQELASPLSQDSHKATNIVSLNFVSKIGSLAAILCFIALIPMMLDKTTPIETTRIKGESYLSLFKKTNQEPIRLSESDTLQAGDLIQIRMHPRGTKHGAIFSIDGNGAYTFHQLADGDSSTRIERAGPQLLPFSYELDDAPKFEQFFFISSSQKFNPDEIIKTIKSQCPEKQECTSLQLDSTLNHYSMTLIKAER